MFINQNWLDMMMDGRSFKKIYFVIDLVYTVSSSTFFVHRVNLSTGSFGFSL